MAIALQRTQLLGKIEAVEGSKENLSATDAVLVYDTGFDPAQEINQRDPHRETLSVMMPVPGARSSKVKFAVELKGSGTKGTAPEWGKFLKACGFSETIVANTSVTYTPASSSIPSMTLGLYRDGVINRIWGARGTVSLELEAGKFGMLHFEFTGADYERVDGALVSASYQSTVPPAFLSATFTADSYAAVIDKLTIDVANAIALRSSPNAASGHVSATITGRAPKVTFDPETVTVATKDFLGLMKAGTAFALSCSLGSAAGNTIAISCPKLVLNDLKEGNRAGILTDQLTAAAAMNAGDDELSIALT
jgi:hypothetical protein